MKLSKCLIPSYTFAGRRNRVRLNVPRLLAPLQGAAVDISANSASNGVRFREATEHDDDVNVFDESRIEESIRAPSVMNNSLFVHSPTAKMVSGGVSPPGRGDHP